MKQLKVSSSQLTYVLHRISQCRVLEHVIIPVFKIPFFLSFLGGKMQTVLIVIYFNKQTPADHMQRKHSPQLNRTNSKRTLTSRRRNILCLVFFVFIISFVLSCLYLLKDHSLALVTWTGLSCTTNHTDLPYNSNKHTSCIYLYKPAITTEYSTSFATVVYKSFAYML